MATTIAFSWIQRSVSNCCRARGEFLQFCGQTGRRTFILSSAHEDHFSAQARELGLDGHFEACYAGVRDKRQKIHEILESHGLDSGQTMFVGDMVHDVETARHGGVMSVATLTGYDPPDRLAAAEPDLTIRNLDTLKAILQNC